MSTCFVIQPFDGETFDKRYAEVYAPAIREAGLEPYRVDQDPRVSIPIDEIENGIRGARMCLAEITLDNPNVWFELGFAIACGKEVVLICSEERLTKFPFDVQHRTIIKYASKIPSDFAKLQDGITSKIKAYLEKAESLNSIPAKMTSLISEQAGLSAHEVTALAAVAQSLDHEEDNSSSWTIKRDMEASGYTPIAATLALKLLVNRGYLAWDRYPGQDDDYVGYTLTTQGWNWVLANQDKFSLRQTRPSAPPRNAKPIGRSDDDIPF